MQKRTTAILGNVQNMQSNSVFVNGIGAHTPPHKRRKNSVSSTNNGEDSKHVSTSTESVSKLTVLSSNVRKRARDDVFNVTAVPIRRSARIVALRSFVSDLGVSTDLPSMDVINNGSLTLTQVSTVNSGMTLSDNLGDSDNNDDYSGFKAISDSASTGPAEIFDPSPRPMPSLPMGFSDCNYDSDSL